MIENIEEWKWKNKFKQVRPKCSEKKSEFCVSEVAIETGGCVAVIT